MTIFSDYELKINDNDVECPYCGWKYQLEGESFSEDPVTETCDQCGKKFHRYCTIRTDVRCEPDCLLNGQEHADHPDYDGYRSCSRCDAFLGKSDD